MKSNVMICGCLMLMAATPGHADTIDKTAENSNTFASRQALHELRSARNNYYNLDNPTHKEKNLALMKVGAALSTFLILVGNTPQAETLRKQTQTLDHLRGLILHHAGEALLHSTQGNIPTASKHLKTAGKTLETLNIELRTARRLTQS